MKLKYQILEKESKAILKLKEVKNFLRISHDYDDSLVKELILAATEYAENFIGKFINVRKIQCSVFRSKRKINIKYTPFNKLISADKIVKDKAEDITDSFDESNLGESYIEINPIYIDQDMIIKFCCGYGEKTPQAIKMGILKNVAAMYELNENSLDPVDEVRNLYLPYRAFKI